MLLTTTLSKDQIVPTEMQRPLTRVEDSWGEQAQPAERSQGRKGGVTPGLSSSMVLAFQLPMSLLHLKLCLLLKSRAKTRVQYIFPNLSKCLFLANVIIILSYHQSPALVDNLLVLQDCVKKDSKVMSCPAPARKSDMINENISVVGWGNRQPVPYICCIWTGLCPEKGLRNRILRAGADSNS